MLFLARPILPPTARRVLALAIVPLLAATAVRADDIICRVPMADWQPREAVQALVEGQGLTVRRIKIDDGCYQVHARDGQGRDVKLMLDPATLQVVLVPQRRHGHDGDDHD